MIISINIEFYVHVLLVKAKPHQPRTFTNQMFQNGIINHETEPFCMQVLTFISSATEMSHP